MTSAQLTLFAAVLFQVALTAVLYLMLVRARFAYAADKANVRPEMAYDQTAWPVPARQISNSVMSQFELPVLFFVGVLFAYNFGAADWISAIIAWLFVVLRIVHAFIHTGKNVVMQRFGVFLGGFIAVIALWIYVAVHVFSAGAI